MMPIDRAATMPADWGMRDGRGLRASRKRRSGEGDHKQPGDVPDARGRDQGRVRKIIRDIRTDVRTLGTIDGNHVASPTRAPTLNPGPNEGRTVADRDLARHSRVDFIR